MYGIACASAPGPAPCTPAGDPYARYAPAAAAVAERSAPGSGWRAALLGTVAAGALAVTAAPGHAAPGPCIVAGNTVTCTGDQSAGIASGTDFDPTAIDTLNVNSLTGDIAPPAGVYGIFFERTGAGNSITINSNAGAFAITPTGLLARGIHAVADGAVTINHTGDITNGGMGVYAISNLGPVSITSAGTIATPNVGIYTRASGALTVSHTGDVTSQNSAAIYARSLSSTTNLTINGNITANLDGIFAVGSGDATVQHTGNVTSTTARGIAVLSNNGAVSITSVGDIIADQQGITASGLGNATVQHTGNVVATQDWGVYAGSITGTATVTMNGNITAGRFGIIAFGNLAAVTHTGDIAAGLDGINANGATGVTITHTGNITSTTGRGVYASSSAAINITTTGNITAQENAIEAINCGCSGGITITHTGDLTSTAGSGIYALSPAGAVIITSRGTINAYGPGIAAVGYGAVTVQHTGDITSTAYSGITALSLYGPVIVTTVGNITAYGNGISATGYGNVTVQHTGNISAPNGTGIYAISGNGSVNVTSTGNITAFCCGISGLALGDVTISHTGDITTTGGPGISAVSYAGNINVTVNGGRIYGQFAGIAVYGGALNTITVGPGATVTGGTFAILAGGTASNTVNNFGIVTGDVLLGGGPNAFNNMAGGLFNSGATVDLNGGGLFNSGTVAPGGIGTIQTTNLTGNFVQNAGGRFAVDVNLAAGTSDVMIVSGTATVAGYVVPNIFNTGGLPQTFTILSAAGGVTDNGLAIHNTAVITVDGQLLYPNPNDIQLLINSITVNFAPSGLTPNQLATAQHLHGAFLTGGGNLTTILNYLSGLDFAAFAAALDQLHPEPYLASVQTMLWSGFNFGNALMSCPAPSETGLVLAKEGSCLWLRAEGHTTSLRASPGFIGFDERAGGFSAGMQRALTEHWFVSAAIGYERSEIDVDTRARARGNVFHGGAALKYIDGNFLAAASVNGGFARYDTTRFNIPTAGNASADADIGLFNARLRFAYTVGSPVFHVKPLIDFDLTGLFRGAINESGAGSLNLQVQSKTDWVFSAAPALEFAGEWREGERHWRPYLRLGVRVLSKDSFNATALFQGSPAGTTPFTVTTPLDRVLGEVSAGVDVWQAGRYSLRLGYDGRFGEHTRQHGGQLKLRAAF